VYIKYSKKLLEDACKQSISIAQVLRVLGLRQAGGTQSHIKKKILSYGIDISHFLGSKTNSGVRHVGGKYKRTSEEILVVNQSNDRREKATHLRRALLESDVKHECEVCKLPPLWNGKYLQLQIDHKNGDFLDNRKENLRFICGNCHMQTSNFSRRKDSMVKK
jgi:hypothetical protein